MNTHKKPSQYISNPFKLVFEGLDKLFTYNQVMAIVIIVGGLFGAFTNFGGFPIGDTSPGSSSTSSGSVDSAAIVAVGLAVFIFLLIVVPIIVFITTVFQGMVAYTIVRTSQNKTVTIKEAFQASLKKFWVVLWTQIIVSLKIFGGLLLFVIPGIRAMLRYKMVILPIFDHNATTKQAIEQSKALTKNHLVEVFGMSFAAGIIPIVGPALDAGGQSIMYPQLVHLKNTKAEKPPVHWLNYVGMLAAVILVGLISLVFIALVAISSAM